MENQNTGELGTMTVYFVDADDLCQGNDGMEVLKRIKANNLDFKITLFTILGRCSKEWVEEMKKIDWIKMVPHGWMHETSRECENWTYEQSIEYLDRIEHLGLEKGFKAPGWQISDGMFKALLEKGYWVADQHYNDERRPKGLKVCYPTNEHYHIGHLGGHNVNEIGYFEEYLSNLKGNFQFLPIEK